MPPRKTTAAQRAPVAPPAPDPAALDVWLAEGQHPDAVLDRLGIKARCFAARKWATVWATILGWVARGATDQTACKIARLPYRTWLSWLSKGRGSEVPGEEHEPESPWDELAAAHAEAKATVIGDVWSALTDAAKAGDVNAARMLLQRRSAEDERRDARDRHRAEMRLLALKIREQEMKLEGTLPASRTEVSGPGGGPIQQELRARVVLLPPLEPEAHALNAPEEPASLDAVTDERPGETRDNYGSDGSGGW